MKIKMLIRTIEHCMKDIYYEDIAKKLKEADIKRGVEFYGEIKLTKEQGEALWDAAKRNYLVVMLIKPIKEE